MHSNAAGDAAALANLYEMLIEGRKILGEGMMLFGAPWLLGRDGIKGAKSEMKRLKNAIAAGEDLVAKIP